MLKFFLSNHAARCAFIVMTAVGAMTSAQAQPTGYHQLVDVAEVQSMVTQRMAVEALLVALEVDRLPNLQQLKSSRDEFESAISGIRESMRTLPLPADNGLEIISQIEQTQELWQSMDAVIASGISGNDMTEEDVRDIAEFSQTLQDVVEDLAETLRAQSKVGESFSMLGVAVETVSETRTLSQQMTKEFLLIASGHQPDRYRYALRESVEKFEAGIQGLIEGDSDRLLLPAPTPEIRAQLQRIEQIWKDEYQPLIDRTVNEEDMTGIAIAQMAWVNQRLLREIDSAAMLFRRL